jgi:hypothetical protein
MSGKLGEEAINALLTYFRSKGKMVKEAHIELTTVFGPECGVTQAYCERFYSDTNKAAVEEANKMDKGILIFCRIIFLEIYQKIVSF